MESIRSVSRWSAGVITWKRRSMMLGRSFRRDVCDARANLSSSSPRNALARSSFEKLKNTSPRLIIFESDTAMIPVIPDRLALRNRSHAPGWVAESTLAGGQHSTLPSPGLHAPAPTPRAGQPSGRCQQRWAADIPRWDVRRDRRQRACRALDGNACTPTLSQRRTPGFLRRQRLREASHGEEPRDLRSALSSQSDSVASGVGAPAPVPPSLRERVAEPLGTEGMLLSTGDS